VYAVRDAYTNASGEWRSIRWWAQLSEKAEAALEQAVALEMSCCWMACMPISHACCAVRLLCVMISLVACKHTHTSLIRRHAHRPL
jgi:hypothetical protein